MDIRFAQNAFTISSGCRVFRLGWPEFRVEEGVLSQENCQERREDRDGDRLTLYLRWTIKGRSYSGRALLEIMGNGVVWQFQLAPEDGLYWRLSESSEGSGELLGWKQAETIRLFHGDNIRGVTQKTSLMEGAYFLPVSEWKSPLNAGRWLSFPGLWLTNGEVGFVSGVLTQAVWRQVVHGEIASASSIRLLAKMSAPGIDAKFFAPGEIYVGEKLYFEWVEADAPAQAFKGYLDALSAHLQPCMRRSILRRAVSWGSWNDRRPHFWDVSDTLLMRTAKVMRERFPTVRALQVDDGYAEGGLYEVIPDRWTKLEHGLDPDAETTIQRVRRLGVAFLHEPNHAIAKDRFPEGMRAARDQIAHAGFMPAIWLGLNFIYDAALAKDHPEWMIHPQPRPHADPELYSVFGQHISQGFRILDPSLPEVRHYLEEVADVLLQKWGFDSLKLDFWTYAFENDSFRLRHSEKSAYEWRQWLLECFHARLAPDGFFTIACDISTGNPFLCPWVDNVRYGIDIGNGRWENIKYSALTGTFLLHVQAYRFYILNPDSVGLLENLAINERLLFWSWAAVTRSLCELAGDLAEQPREKLRELQKLLLAPKNGEPAFIGETQHLLNNEPAAIIWTHGDMFSTAESSKHTPNAVLAVINWSDAPRSFSVDASRLGIKCEQIADIDFFGNQHLFHQHDKWEITLPARSARLSQISSLVHTEPRILESSWQVRDVRYTTGSLEIHLYGDSPAGFLLYWLEAKEPAFSSTIPVQVVCEGAQLFRIIPRLEEDRLAEWRISLRKT